MNKPINMRTKILIISANAMGDTYLSAAAIDPCACVSVLSLKFIYSL